MNRTAIPIFTLVTLFAAPLLAGAPHRRMPPSDRAGTGGSEEGGTGFAARLAERHSARLTRALDLTAAQQATLGELQAALGDTLRPLFDSLRATRDELEALLEGENADAAAVGAKTIALHETRAAMRSAHETFEAGIVAMLTETQRAQYEALREARPGGERGRFFRGERSQ